MKTAETMLLAGVLLLAAGVTGTGWAQPPVAGTKYIYNYPHRLPPDYVYRTGRIFVPPPGSRSVAPGPSQAVGPAGAVAPAAVEAQAFCRRIGELAGQLLATAEEEIDDQYRVAVSTFVNLNNLYRTSALGRYLSEQLMGDLQGAGVEVVELRRTPAIMVSQAHGEYALSRDMGELAFTQAVQATLVGTYVVAADQLFVNARLLRNRDNGVLASASFTVPLDPLLEGLLADEAMPAGGGAPVKIRAHKADGNGA